MPESADKAKSLGRNPYDNYAGFNLQGKEPQLSSGTSDYSDKRWSYLKTQEASIGLWSGHDSNMFWEARNTYGSDPYKSQLTYQQLLERWFTGQDAKGICSPLNKIAIDESLSNDLNETFFGMSKFVAAQSTLCWDLATEPFITYFNLGNGKFFNYKGKRQHSSEWYNIGVQDYLPTWRWWWSSDKALGTTATTSMKAAFDWNDAWFGGSSLHITGTEQNANYLNLFKTHYALESGDVITFRYKINSGDVSDVKLVLVTNQGNFEEVIIKDGAVGDRGLWAEKTITLLSDISNLAAIALKFEGASKLDMNVGELSIKRGTYNAEVPTPTIASTTILNFSLSGIDGKIIYNLDESKPYNIDNGVSMFNIYAKITYRDKTEQITHMGSTTSWAGIFYNCPYDLDKLKNNAKIRLGVSAVGIDGVKESKIVWGDESTLSYNNGESDKNYVISDVIEVSPNNITNGEKFTVKYADPQHAAATSWKLVGPYNGIVDGVTTITAATSATGFTAKANTAIENISGVNINSLPVGFYDLIVNENGTERTLKAFVQVYSKEVSYPTLTKLVALDTDGAGNLVHEISAEEADKLKVGDGKTPAREIRLVTEDGVKVLEQGKSFTKAGAGAGIKISTDNDGQVTPLYLYYEADSKSTGEISAAAGLGDQALGVKASDLGLTAKNQSFTVSFWMKLKSINAKSWLLNIRAPQTEVWPKRAWGWMWTEYLNTDGTYDNVKVRGTSTESWYVFDKTDDKVKFEKNSWYHVAYVFDHSKDTFSFYVNGRKVSYTTSKSGTWNSFSGDYYISLGGMAGKGDFAGFDADIDNFCVFNTALSEAAISSTMVEDPSKQSAVSSSLVGFWDFEPAVEGGEIAYNDGYTNKSSLKPDAKLIHHYWPTDMDDSKTQTMISSTNATTSLGYPNFNVGGLTVNINPSYTVVGARSYTIDETASGSEIVGSTELGRAAPATAEVLTAAQVESAPMLFAAGDASAKDLQTGLKGFAKVTYDAPASGVMNIYTVKLHVDNGIGTDDAEYKYVYVTNWQNGLYTGITDVTDSKVMVFPNPVVDNVFVCVDADGQYKVDVFNIEGKQVASHSEHANAGECIAMPADWAQGTYVIRVACNNDTICTVKVNKN